MNSDSLPPPRDPEAAVQEEFDLARKAGTAEALELFIARHNSHGLAERARRVLATMKRL